MILHYRLVKSSCLEKNKISAWHAKPPLSFYIFRVHNNTRLITEYALAAAKEHYRRKMGDEKTSPFLKLLG